MPDFQFSEAMDHSRETTELLVEQMAEHLLNGVSPSDLSQVIFAVLLEAPPNIVANGLSWFILNAALDVAAKKGTVEDGEAA